MQNYHFHTQKHSSGAEFIVCLHPKSTALKPAIGGCRLTMHADITLAKEEALKLAQTMQQKSHAHHLPCTGGKAVINNIHLGDRTTVLRDFASFINTLNGAYITAVDVGTTPEDMSVIAEKTDYVINPSHDQYTYVDPSFYTAYGVYKSIQAVKDACHLPSSLTINILGLGGTGSYLASMLCHDQHQVFGHDISPTRAKMISRQEPDLSLLDEHAIYSTPCHIFAPCALADSVNHDNIHYFKNTYIIGAANNPIESTLLESCHHHMVDDFICNAGGVIFAAGCHQGLTEESIIERVASIYDKTLSLSPRLMGATA